jgi:hypothetical protein
MSEFFQGGESCKATKDRSVVICSPPANSIVSSPVQLSAAAKDNQYPITEMVVYANGQIVAQSSDSTLNATVPLNPGPYQLLVRARDSNGFFFSSQENITVKSCAAMQDKTVVICSPQENQSTGSPVHIMAAAKDEEHSITGMVAYANSRIIAQSNGATIDASVALGRGQYQLVIRAWDSNGYYFSSAENFTVK